MVDELILPAPHVPSVMNSIDTPNSVDVTCVAVLNMLLEKGEGEG